MRKQILYIGILAEDKCGELLILAVCEIRDFLSRIKLLGLVVFYSYIPQRGIRIRELLEEMKRVTGREEEGGDGLDLGGT